MTEPASGSEYAVYVREQIQSLTEALTRVMFGDFNTVAQVKAPDDAFGYLCVMVNVAINAARNAQGELRLANAQLSAANERLQDTVARQKRAEEEIRRLNENLERLVDQRTVELKEAIKELEAFSYSVSHDLRAPLRSIDGFSQLLLKDHAAALDDKGKDYLQRVRAAAQRMAALIDDLLQLSRVGRAELRRARVDLSAMARSIIAELSRNDPQRRVEVAIQDALVADADPSLLRVVCDNLLGNAWKFTSKVAAPKIELNVSEEGGETVYRVRDNGAGFDMAYVHRLFGPFQRLHSDVEFPGTGIGLATVQRIIARHGGRVWAEGAVGRGASFWFTLPAPTHAGAP